MDIMSDDLQLVGGPCGQHGPYTFYKAFRYTKNGRKRIVTLSEFFFVKLWIDSDLLCIGELQLLWSDKNNDQVLASLRLYFLPENTPEGRTDHGEDEVLAISEKVVLRVEDLISWITVDAEWTWGRLAKCEREVKDPPPTHSQGGGEGAAGEGVCGEGDNNNKKMMGGGGGGAGLTESSLDFSDVEKEKRETDCAAEPECPRVLILSYPRYCRYRAMMRRLEGVEDEYLKYRIVTALGGFTACSKNTRVLFCKETFDYPELEGHEMLCNHLAPKLKGRPRGKRRKKRSMSPGGGGEDSNESESSLSNVGVGYTRSCSSKDKLSTHDTGLAKKNGLRYDYSTTSNLRRSTRSTENSDSKTFYRKLGVFKRAAGSRRQIRNPFVGSKELNLYTFYHKVRKMGGYDSVTSNRLWKSMYEDMAGHQTQLRKLYEKFLLAYERHEKGQEYKPFGVVRSRRIRTKSLKSESCTTSDGDSASEGTSRSGNSSPAPGSSRSTTRVPTLVTPCSTPTENKEFDTKIKSGTSKTSSSLRCIRVKPERQKDKFKFQTSTPKTTSNSDTNNRHGASPTEQDPLEEEEEDEEEDSLEEDPLHEEEEHPLKDILDEDPLKDFSEEDPLKDISCSDSTSVANSSDPTSSEQQQQQQTCNNSENSDKQDSDKVVNNPKICETSDNKNNSSSIVEEEQQQQDAKSDGDTKCQDSKTIVNGLKSESDSDKTATNPEDSVELARKPETSLKISIQVINDVCRIKPDDSQVDNVSLVKREPTPTLVDDPKSDFIPNLDDNLVKRETTPPPVKNIKPESIPNSPEKTVEPVTSAVAPVAQKLPLLPPEKSRSPVEGKENIPADIPVLKTGDVPTITTLSTTINTNIGTKISPQEEILATRNLTNTTCVPSTYHNQTPEKIAEFDGVGRLQQPFSQDVKRAKLDILKEGGLEVTPVKTPILLTAPVINKDFRPSVIQPPHTIQRNVVAPPPITSSLRTTVQPSLPGINIHTSINHQIPPPSSETSSKSSSTTGHVVLPPNLSSCTVKPPVQIHVPQAIKISQIPVTPQQQQQPPPKQLVSQQITQKPPYTASLPPKVLQSKSIYSYSEKTVYGNPKEDFGRLSNHDVHTPRFYSEPSRYQPGGDILDLTVSSPQKAISNEHHHHHSNMRVPSLTSFNFNTGRFDHGNSAVPTTAHQPVQQQQQQQQHSNFLEGRRLGNNLEITLVKPHNPGKTSAPIGNKNNQSLQGTSQKYGSQKRPHSSSSHDNQGGSFRGTPAKIPRIEENHHQAVKNYKNPAAMYAAAAMMGVNTGQLRGENSHGKNTNKDMADIIIPPYAAYVSRRQQQQQLQEQQQQQQHQTSVRNNTSQQHKSPLTAVKNNNNNSQLPQQQQQIGSANNSIPSSASSKLSHRQNLPLPLHVVPAPSALPPIHPLPAYLSQLYEAQNKGMPPPPYLPSLLDPIYYSAAAAATMQNLYNNRNNNSNINNGGNNSALLGAPVLPFPPSEQMKFYTELMAQHGSRLMNFPSPFIGNTASGSGSVPLGVPPSTTTSDVNRTLGNLNTGNNSNNGSFSNKKQ